MNKKSAGQQVLYQRRYRGYTLSAKKLCLNFTGVSPINSDDESCDMYE